MENEKIIKVTSLEELKGYAKGNVVELPPFAEGQPFFAMLRRPSMMGLVKSKKIPNRLLITANKLFEEGVQGSFDSLDEKALDDMMDVMEVICEASFVSPTYKEIKDNGIELTDDQLLFVFGYSQTGVNQLNSFRQ